MNNWLLQKNVFISTYQIIIFQINIMKSTSRSRSNPKRQIDVVMKSRSRLPTNVDTQECHKENLLKEYSKPNYYESSKNEGD